MQYTDYIKAYNDRIEREQQLVAKYNQKPKLPVISRKSQKVYELIEIVTGIALVGGILVASVLIG